MPMLAQEIKSRLRQAQVSQRDIACRCRVSNTAVCLVIAGKSVSRRIQMAVAEAIGLPVDDVFPPAGINPPA